MAETIEMNADGSVRNANIESEKTVLHVMYLMHALAPFTVWTLAALAVFIGYLKRDNVRGTYLESHYKWLAGAFWWALGWMVAAWAVAGLVTLVTLGLGALVMWIPVLIVYGVLWVWYAYRVVRGWLTLTENRPLA